MFKAVVIALSAFQVNAALTPDQSTCKIWFDGCNNCAVISGNRLADCTEKKCTTTTDPYCFKAKTNLDNLVKDKLYGPKSSTGGRIDDLRINTGIKGFDKIEL